MNRAMTILFTSTACAEVSETIIIAHWLMASKRLKASKTDRHGELFRNTTGQAIQTSEQAI